MDTPKAITHVSLCAGYGGIDLGLKRAIGNLRTIAFSEIEAFACANLVAKMEAGHLDPAPIWTDVKTFPYAQLQYCVDVLSGGYPCQPFSAAGQRLGKCDPRHLWPWILPGIDAMRPRFCFFENVEGHVTLGLREVIEELEGIGYRTTWGLFSAAEVGAPHQRKRVFILAHRDSSGSQGWDCPILPERAGELPAWPSGPSAAQHEWEPPRVVGDTTSGNGQRQASRDTGHAAQPDQGMADATIIGGGALWKEVGEPDRAGWTSGAVKQHVCIGQAQPPLGGDPDGCAHRLGHAKLYRSTDNRTNELRLLGNGVVPATAERAFRTLYGRLALI
jgi:DNA (cytosine-5)-methyltransferase 1